MAVAEQSRETQCAELLRFEMLLTDLSSRFVNLLPGELQCRIEDAQRQICETLGLDLSGLWEWNSKSGAITLTHLYSAPGGPVAPSPMEASEYFPWMMRQLEAGRTVVLSSVSELPPDASRDLASFAQFGIKTAVVFPLLVGGSRPLGHMSFNDIRTERRWTDELVGRLHVIAQIFANALAREASEQALRESEERVSLATAAADAGLWILNESRDSFWVNAKICELFGFPPGHEMGVTQFLARVHPDDRQRVHDAMIQAAKVDEVSTVEYRFVRPDGQVRWMITRGRPYASREGGAARLMGITADITERKVREETIQSMEVQIASAVDVAGLGFYCMEEEGRTRFLDHRIRDLIGVPPGEEARVRDFWLEHIHEEDRPKMLHASRDVIENGKDRLVMEYRYCHPERGLVWLCQQANVMARDAAGRATRIIGVLQDITDRKRTEEELRGMLEEVQRLRDQLQNENVYLREQMRSEAGNGAIIGDSAPVRTMITLARRVAPTDSAVLITGETGTGKELLAQYIHDLSSRRAKTMVKVNCAALPAPLIESELFGREKGAYTGAMTQQVGRFELADKSTIFLDEIGELHADIQVKLLRILQDGKYERLGGHRTFKTDIRVIAATNRDLAAMVKDGRFREDLFHRLNVFPIEVAPLRERTGDIPILVWKIVQEFNTKMGRTIDAIPKTTMERLQSYPWPGNVRELRNVIERAMILSDGHSLKIQLPSAEPGSAARPVTLEEAERAHILAALEYARWRISGKGGAAETLGLVPTTLHSTMKRLGVTRPAR